MRLPMRDAIATLFVAVGLLIAATWALGLEMPGFTSVTAVAAAVLLLGIAASASAVVPGFADLLHGSRMYLAVSSGLGAVALVAGLVALSGGEPLALAALVLATAALWAMATARHVARPGPMEHPRHG